MRNMKKDDFKALNELKKMGAPDDLIQEGIKNTVEKNKKTEHISNEEFLLRFGYGRREE